MTTVVRAWCAVHRARTAMAILLALLVCDAVFARSSAGHPLGTAFASPRVAILAPTFGSAAVTVLLNDELDHQVALAGRSLSTVRGLWLAAAVTAYGVALLPLAVAVPARQLLVDAMFYPGLCAAGLCLGGVGLGFLLPFLILVPHLLRREGQGARWWMILDSSRLGLATAVAVAVLVLGAALYATHGPKGSGHALAGLH